MNAITEAKEKLKELAAEAKAARELEAKERAAEKVVREKRYEDKTKYPKVKELTRKDRKKMSKLIKDFADRSGNSKLTSMIPGVKKPASEKETKAEDKETEVYDLIKSVLEGLLTWVEEDVNKWFMYLLDVTDQDKYDELPFDIEVYVIDKLIDQDGFNGFFTRASALYKRIRG